MTPTNQDQTFVIDPLLVNFISNEVMPHLDLDEPTFWRGVQNLLTELCDANQTLLDTRHDLQTKINRWHETNNYAETNYDDYRQFLTDIDYITPEPEPFTISTSNVDPEVATIAGPQLVVPVQNARFALNAANARWGSLYDALYGTNALSAPNPQDFEQHNSDRATEVVSYVRQFLDATFPLSQYSHAEVKSYEITGQSLIATDINGKRSLLGYSSQFVGFDGTKEQPTSILLRNNGLHVELRIDRQGNIGRTDLAGIDDVIIESAVTTIADCEDSVAAVDTEDKVDVYRNWLGLMTGDLTATFTKNGDSITRSLNADREFVSKSGGAYIVPGRSLLFIRNVGPSMYTDMVTTSAGDSVPEGIIDGIVTSLIASIDIHNKGTFRNSRTGSIYIVKPKLHGPKEVEFTNTMFSQIESILDLEPNTIKLGIMDEERRTTVNLASCIHEARTRVAFINTGFLDRTGDEIHTSMLAGPFVRKNAMKSEPWIAAYERRNVDIGLATGFHGRAQIGKGMWAKPDEMGEMLQTKGGHPRSGATTAWVPSPTAAVLHALHYHEVDVQALHFELTNRSQADLEDILTIPLLKPGLELSPPEIQDELENNIQGILGYVVRWVQSGIGCSKVPDIDNIGLMEDRATLRISSQHVANWLTHEICSPKQVQTVLEEMAVIVDEQNRTEPGYRPMADDFSRSLAFNAARDLIFYGASQPNGYTETILHRYRAITKSMFNPSSDHPSTLTRQ